MSKRRDLVIGLLMAGSFLVFVLLMISAFRMMRGEEFSLTSGGSKVAVIELVGPIVDSRSIVRQFRKYGRDDDIEAIIFRIESPGGGVAPSQEIYEEVKRVRNSGKIVVASMGSVAASGGYYVALGATKIVANRGTLTGSIGVIIGLLNYSDLMGKIGMSMQNITSGPFKDSGSPYRELTGADREYFQELVDDIYSQFIADVAEERGMDLDVVKSIASGKVYTGLQAKDIGLVDTVGTYEDAIRLAAQMVGIVGRPKIVRERRKQPTIYDLFFGDTKSTLDAFIPFPIPEYRLNY